MGRKIGIFSLGRKNNVLVRKKECTAVNAIHHKAPEMSTLEDTHM